MPNYDTVLAEASRLPVVDRIQLIEALWDTVPAGALPPLSDEWIAEIQRRSAEYDSGSVQAVACFFPPTDFLNYGTPGNVALGENLLKGFRAPFQFRELDPKTACYVQITDQKRVLEIGRQISPVYHVTKDDPPTLIVHGDADKLVPIQQAELMMAKFKEAGVPAELVVKKGAGHGWVTIGQDQKTIADWFDKYLKKP